MATDPLARLLERAASHPGPTIQLGLERIQALLARLQQPQQSLACLQVAGSNGKGSTVAFLEAMLRAGGQSVGCYTSPHLRRFHERIRVDGREIGDDDLARCLGEALAADTAGNATFFELTTAAALCHFARQAPRWVVLETGLGGRLDATTAVHPRLCLISAIALEHTDYLGDRLEGIAAEKAGILKVGVPAVADPADPAAGRVVSDRARQVGAPLWLRGREYDYRILADGRWRYQDPAGHLLLPPPGLAGPHQYANAALAVAGLRLLRPNGRPPDPAALAAGLAAARWPGRLERFAGPPEVWLDGAHNPAAAVALANAWAALPPAPTGVLFAALQDKAAPAMIAALAPWVTQAWTVAVGGPRGRPAAELAALWQAAGIPATPCTDPAQALTQARRELPPPSRLLVTGSLFLVGAVRSLL